MPDEAADRAATMAALARKVARHALAELRHGAVTA